MSKRLNDREKLQSKFQQMTDREVEDVLDYVLMMERTYHPPTSRDSFRDQKANQNSTNPDDELLVSLSSAYENRRALQVFEWESVRRRAEVKAGSFTRG